MFSSWICNNGKLIEVYNGRLGKGKMDQHVYDGSSDVPDFSFAFDNINFSDRQLRIEIRPDSQRLSYGIAFLNFDH